MKRPLMPGTLLMHTKQLLQNCPLAITTILAALLVLAYSFWTSIPARAGVALSSNTGDGSMADITIDVMILYTPQAAQSAGEGIQNRINQAIAEGNQALQDSNIPVTLRSVHIREYAGISDLPSKTHITYLSEIRSDSTIKQLRENYSADLVQLVVKDIAANVWGASLEWPSVAKADRILAPTYTMIHEFAHSIGERHVPPGTKDGMHSTANPCSPPQLCSIMGKYPKQSDGTIPNPVRYGHFSEANARYITLGAPEVAQNFGSQCQSTQTLFCDVPQSHWAHSDIIEIYNRGITKGCDSSKTPYKDLPFCPSDRVDRAHFAVFLIRRVHDNNQNYTPSGPYRGYFSDVPSSHSQALWIEELYQRGLTTGSTNCPGSGLRFCPDNIVSRQELASFLMRTERYLGNISDYSTRPIRGYFDDVPTDNVHLRAIEYMFEAGYTNGCSSNDEEDLLNFCPLAPVDRATAAVFMARIFRYRSIQALDPLEPDNSYSRPSSITPSFAQYTQASAINSMLIAGAAVTQQRNIAPVTDRDWIQFSLSTESAVRIETSGSTGDTRIWLYDNELNELAYDNDSGTGSFSQIMYNCSSNPLLAGSYYLFIDEYGNDDEIPAYELTLEATETCQPSAPLANIQVWIDDTLGNQKATFHQAEIIGMGLAINNTKASVLPTMWDWIVTDSTGLEIADLTSRDNSVDSKPGPNAFGLHRTIPPTLKDGFYTFTGRVRTADSSYSMESSAQFNVIATSSSMSLFLPIVIR